GPGMDDFERCAQDGYSSAGSPGNGLGAVRRTADVFDCYSQRGQGTAMLARIGGTPKSFNPDDNGYSLGGLSTNYPGELECGDAWDASLNHRSIFLADGLGHGASAAAASRMARDIFQTYADEDCVSLLTRIHRALAATRGAAVAIAKIEPQSGQVRFAGLGNI